MNNNREEQTHDCFFLFAINNNNVSKYFRLFVTYDSVEVTFFFLWPIIFLSYCKHRKNNNKKKTEGQRWWWHQQQYILSWEGRNWKVNNICLHVVITQKKSKKKLNYTMISKVIFRCLINCEILYTHPHQDKHSTTW